MSSAVSKAQIREALAKISDGDFQETAANLLKVLGYESDLTLLDQTGDGSYFVKNPNTRSGQSFLENTQSSYVLLQVTNTEISATENQGLLLSEEAIEESNAKSFLFVAVEMKETRDSYPRGLYAELAREVNKPFPMPTVVLFKTNGNLLTLAFVHRRRHRFQPERDVLGAVSLIREIDIDDPHRAHLDILTDLSLKHRLQWMKDKGKLENFDSLLDAWLDTLDTEKLNRTFYKELFAWFEQAIKVSKFPTDQPRTISGEKHIIRLITRFLFIWFIKEKGLVATSLFEEEQVKSLLKNYDRDTGDSYYRAILQNLFFATLNAEIGTRRFSRQTYDDHRNSTLYRYKSEIVDKEEFLELFSQTPFINGGLFDSLDSFEGNSQGGWRLDCFSDNVITPGRREHGILSIPNRLFFGDNGLINLFNRYKFTVEENTPVEQEVALDPELLGKVFENLLASYTPETKKTARKQSGSYYTPRPIVDYMVGEALAKVLSEKVTSLVGDKSFLHERLQYLFDYEGDHDDARELFEPDERTGLIRAIAEIKIIDPAVGSGAFPMGVLHRLTLGLQRLDPDNSQWEKIQKELAIERAGLAFDIDDLDERSEELVEISEVFEHYRFDFGRKLFLIQNSIFGVDIQAIACQIAKLRFFITLAIEQDPTDDIGNNYGIKPLPNLETRFVIADTLNSLGRRVLTNGKSQDIIQELRRNREQYFLAANRDDKKRCRDFDKAKREELAKELQQVSGLSEGEAEKMANWDPYDQNATVNWFDPDYMFGITKDIGFDIVIGNPPYAKTEHIPVSYRKKLKQKYGWLGDLYEHFIFEGLELTGSSGIFSYIANDSFVTFSGKRRIRELLLKNQLLHLVRAPSSTFDASIYTAVFVLCKKVPHTEHYYCSGKMDADFNFRYQFLGKVSYQTVLSIPEKVLLTSESSLLSRLLRIDKTVENYYQILDTGIDSGNVRSKIFFQENDGTRSRLLQGRQIDRYLVSWDSPKANYKYCNAQYEVLPILGIGRGGKPSLRKEYWKFRGSIENHHQPERLLVRQTDDDLVVAYQSEKIHGQFYTDNTLHTILSKHNLSLKYLLALLNSRLLNYIYQSITQEKGKSQAQVKIKNVRRLPLVVPGSKIEGTLIRLVDQIIEVKLTNSKADTSELEAEIDRLVYQVYGLTDEEIAVVEDR